MKKRIGDFYLEKKVITPEQLDEVLQYSRKTGLRFGDAALEMGAISRDEMVQVFGPNFRIDYFHLEPQYFPKVTEEFLSKDEIFKYGALPLGMKKSYGLFSAKKLLNIGLLDPSNTENTKQIEALAIERLKAEKVHGLKIYLLLADQFLQVLKSVYQISEDQLNTYQTKEIDDTLQMYLNSDT